MGTVTLFLRGDQIGRYTKLRGDGNGDERVVELRNLEAVGDKDQIYKVVVEQVNDGVTEFQNGQFITIYNPQGGVISPRTNVQPDQEQGRAAGDEHLIITGTKFVIDLGGVPASKSTVQYTKADEASVASEGDNDGNLDFKDFPCLAAGTRVATPDGPRRVEALVAGDRVTTLGGVPREVLWTGAREVTLPEGPDRRKPVLFTAGSLGHGRPARALVVSPQHRIGMVSDAARRLFGAAEVLAPARGLAGLPGVRQMEGKRRITYISVLLDCHAVMLAEGAPVESFYPGAEGLRMLGPELAAEIVRMVPWLATAGVAAYGPPARRMLTMRETEALAGEMHPRRGQRAPEAA